MNIDVVMIESKD